METMQKVVNYQRGESGVFAFGENVTTGITGLYYVPAQFDEGLSATLGTIATNAKEKQRLFTQGGNKACYIYQNETDEAKTTSLNYVDDAIYWQQMAVKQVDKNLLTNLLTGERFMDGNDVVTVIGTNGTKIIADARGKKKITTNNSPYRLFNYVGRMMIPQSDDGNGNPIFMSNLDNDGNKINGKTVGIEAIYTYDDDTKWGVRLLFCMPKKPTMTDGQPNKVAIEFDVYCDTHIIDKTLPEGSSIADVVATTGATPIFTVNAKYAIAVTGGGEPTFTQGAVGDVAVVVDTADGTVEIYKKDATDWGNTPVTSVLGAGCMIHAEKTGTALGAEPTGGAGYIAVDTAGATGVAVASKNKTKATGTGTETYIYKVRYFDLGTSTWIDYTI